MFDFIKKRSVPVIPIVCAVLVVIVCASVLFTEGGAGLSDNGDFQRVMDAGGIKPVDSSYSRYVFKRFYIMDMDGDAPLKSMFSSRGENFMYKSPHMHFINASKLLNYAVNSVSGKDVNTFDIFYLAFIYIVILAVSGYFIISFFKKPLCRIVASVLFLLIFCDCGHILYFNSLYGEGLQFVSLMLICGLTLSFIDRGFGYTRTLLLFAAIYYFGGSKLANIPLAILLCVASIIFTVKIKNHKKIIFCLPLIATVISLGAMYVSIPSWMNNQTTYQSVFFGILKESPSPGEDLKELGLKEEYIALSGTHAYMDNYPVDITSVDFDENFYAKTGKLDAVIFYAKHPVRFIKKCAEAIRESTSIRPIYLGSSPHRRMGQTEKWSLWSNVRGGESIFTNPYIMIPLLFVFSFASAIWLIRLIKRKDFSKKFKVCTMLTLLVCALWANLLLPIAGNGDADLLKHMYLFIHLTDISLFLGIVVLVTNIPDRKSIISLTAVVMVLLVPSIPVSYGKTITFGTYNGVPIQWQIMSEENGKMTMISKDILFSAPFDTNGDFGLNLWAESDLRKYLNGDFLNCFTKEEASLICDTSHQVTLSSNNGGLSQEGSHSPYFRVSRKNAADMYEETFRHTVCDKVYLPDTLSFSKGDFDRCGGSFYLIDPYGASDSMVRFLDKNGVPVYCDARENMGIRPVMTIKKGLY